MWSLGSIFNKVLTIMFVWSFVREFFPSKNENDGGSEKGFVAPSVPTKQHFEFHPTGYGKTPPRKPKEIPDLGNDERTHEKKSLTSLNFQPRGYYEKDAKALFLAVRHVLQEKERVKDSQTDYSSESEFETIETNVQKADGSEQVSDVAIVLDLNPGPDPQYSISFLRTFVTFLIGFSDHLPSLKMEVIVNLDSNGGDVAAYGLLSDQLKRIREGNNNILLTVNCDQRALSGGYMVAALASPGQLLAARHAYIGSIGARSSTVFKVKGILESYGISMVNFKGGKFKDMTNPFNDMSEDEREHMQSHIDSFHEDFKDHVLKWRGDAITDFETATSGAYWTGKKAKDLGLVDKILTSDEYIESKVRSGCSVLRVWPKTNSEKNKKGWMGMIFDFFFSPLPVEESFSSDNGVSFGGDLGQTVLEEMLEVLVRRL